MSNLSALMEELLAEANQDLHARSFPAGPITERIEFIATCLANRAGVRLVMACMLARLDKPEVDPREPVTEIGSSTCFSGRAYDEQYLTAFITRHRLPCNPTTAFLTPAFRNFTKPFLMESVPKGRPPQLYNEVFQLLEDVAQDRADARGVLIDTLRHLVAMRDEQVERMASLLGSIQRTNTPLAPSSESIVTLLEQHLRCKNSSRLPVLGIAAAYAAVAPLIGERALPLRGHLSADLQSGATGDIEICLANESDVITVYEMKKKRVTRNDIDQAVKKIVNASVNIDNYLIVTTDPIPQDVADHARTMYEATDGTEVVILDYLGFVRHFLHFFHRFRGQFLEQYQELLLAEPASAVPQSLKEAFLALRSALQTDEEAVEE